MNRRALVFLLFAAMSAAIVPLADTKHRFVPVVLGAVYVLLALLSWLDSRSR